MNVRLRPAKPEDARLLWRWANDPVLRRASYDPRTIPWRTHRDWFRAKLASPRAARIYVAEIGNGRPAGQVRFDVVEPGLAEVGIGIARALRGRGLGLRVLEAACPRVRRELRVRRIRAFVKVGNSASLALFRSAGFRRVRSLVRKGAPSVLLSWPARPGARPRLDSPRGGMVRRPH